MKRLFTLIAALLPFYALFAQPYLYAISYNSGILNSATITKYDVKANSLTDVHNFQNGQAIPQSKLLAYTRTKFYGVTEWGGTHNKGTIFAYDGQTGKYEQIYSFNGTNGEQPNGGLIKGSDGKLYGVTTYGGTGEGLPGAKVPGAGVLFSFDPNSRVFTKLHDFSLPDAAYPRGPVLQTPDGTIYGVAREGNGGVSDAAGTAFSFDLSGKTIAYPYSFSMANGYNPIGGMVLLNNHIYGTTFNGGTEDVGVLYSFNLAGSIYLKGYDFKQDIKGTYPFGTLTNVNSMFYGLANTGGMHDKGVIYCFNPVTNSYVKKFDFNGSDGEYPNSSLVYASNGKLYGTTNLGGVNGSGVLFAYDVALNAFTKMKEIDKSYNAFTECTGCNFNIVVSNLSIDVLQNPTTTSFKARALSNDWKQLVTFTIYNSSGALVQKGTIYPNKYYSFGSTFAPGTYVINAAQGSSKASITVVKQ